MESIELPPTEKNIVKEEENEKGDANAESEPKEE